MKREYVGRAMLIRQLRSEYPWMRGHICRALKHLERRRDRHDVAGHARYEVRDRTGRVVDYEAKYYNAKYRTLHLNAHQDRWQNRLMSDEFFLWGLPLAPRCVNTWDVDRVAHYVNRFMDRRCAACGAPSHNLDRVPDCGAHRPHQHIWDYEYRVEWRGKGVKAWRKKLRDQIDAANDLIDIANAIRFEADRINYLAEQKRNTPRKTRRIAP